MVESNSITILAVEIHLIAVVFFVGFKYSPAPSIPDNVSNIKNHLTSTNKASSSAEFGVLPDASIKVLTQTGTSIRVPSESSTNIS